MFWTCMLSGAAGHTYGANGIWQLNRRDPPYGKSPMGAPMDRFPGTRRMRACRAQGNSVSPSNFSSIILGSVSSLTRNGQRGHRTTARSRTAASSRCHTPPASRASSGSLMSRFPGQSRSGTLTRDAAIASFFNPVTGELQRSRCRPYRRDRIMDGDTAGRHQDRLGPRSQEAKPSRPAVAAAQSRLRHAPLVRVNMLRNATFSSISQAVFRPRSLDPSYYSAYTYVLFSAGSRGQRL